jgi:hypothetical protein
MEDSNRILEQKALRNVRALVDKLEALEPARPWRPILLLTTVVIIAGLMMWVASSRKVAAVADQRQQRSCEFDVWAAKSGDFERGLRQAHPEMPNVDLQKLLERERPALMAAAQAQCDGRAARAQ